MVMEHALPLARKVLLTGPPPPSTPSLHTPDCQRLPPPGCGSEWHFLFVCLHEILYIPFLHRIRYTPVRQLDEDDQRLLERKVHNQLAQLLEVVGGVLRPALRDGVGGRAPREETERGEGTVDNQSFWKLWKQGPAVWCTGTASGGAEPASLVYELAIDTCRPLSARRTCRLPLRSSWFIWLSLDTCPTSPATRPPNAAAMAPSSTGVSSTTSCSTAAQMHATCLGAGADGAVAGGGGLATSSRHGQQFAWTGWREVQWERRDTHVLDVGSVAHCNWQLAPAC